MIWLIVEVALGPEGGLDPIGDAEALEHAGQMGLDGSLGYAEQAGDLLVGQTLADRRENFALSLGQACWK